MDQQQGWDSNGETVAEMHYPLCIASAVSCGKQGMRSQHLVN